MIEKDKLKKKIRRLWLVTFISYIIDTIPPLSSGGDWSHSMVVDSTLISLLIHLYSLETLYQIVAFFLIYI